MRFDQAIWPAAPCAFRLTPPPAYDSLLALSQERADKLSQETVNRQPRQGRRKGPGDREEARDREKHVFRGNELSHLLQIKDLAFYWCSKRTGFLCKRTQNEPPKRGQEPPFLRHRGQIRDSKGAGGGVQGG
jgi:hypothetical protein